MASNLPARQDEAPLAVDTTHDMHPDGEDPQHQAVEQNIAAGVLPLAIVTLLILAFIAAAWTFLASLPPA